MGEVFQRLVESDKLKNHKFVTLKEYLEAIEREVEAWNNLNATNQNQQSHPSKKQFLGTTLHHFLINFELHFQKQPD